jgi:hypothetical protein
MPQAATPSVISLFDFQSHEKMHLNFNEGYLRTLRIAFPADRIEFHACAGHAETLRARLSDLRDIEYIAIERFTVPWRFSRHNPLAGRYAALKCRSTLFKQIKEKPLRLVGLLGEDANLYAMIGKRWNRISRAPLHMILHNHLGDATRWRSRNPFIRHMDLVSLVQSPLPSNVRIAALELGVQERIKEAYPAIHSSVFTYEHPLLESEWGPENLADQNLAVAFLGNASNTKGFNLFAEITRRHTDADTEFHAIGIASSDSARLELGHLKRQPTPGGLDRAAYLAAIQAVHYVCLPLSNVEYDFIASGSVTDAICGLKPLLALRTRSLDAIVAKYGEIGRIVDSAEALNTAFDDLPSPDSAQYRIWVENLRRIRLARHPSALARDYAAALQ